MEITRFPSGGLNLDDSVELMDPADWFDAVNIVDGRSFSSRNGEKENIRGTVLISSGVTGVLEIVEANSFDGWLNTGTGVSWNSLDGQNTNVVLESNQTSKLAQYSFPSVKTGLIKFSVEYNAPSLAPCTVTFTVKSRLGTVTVDTFTYNIVNNGVPIVIEFNSTPIDNIVLQASINSIPVTPVSNINEWGSGGNYEGTDFGYGTTRSGVIYRVNTQKHEGLYSQAYVHDPDGVGYTGLTLARARFSATSGTDYSISAWVFTPSGNPISVIPSDNIFISAFNEDGAQLPFTVLSQTMKTVGSATNAWQKVEAVIKVNGTGQFYPIITMGSSINPNTNATIYVDEFYVYDLTPSVALTRNFALTAPRITSTVTSTTLDNNSKCIGVIRSAQDDLNYLFFYNSEPTKHCIIKLERGSVSTILRWAGLNFSNLREYRVSGSLAGNLLYFTDNYNGIRCINTTRYSSGGTPTSEEEIALIKRGPLFPPATMINISSSLSKNNIEDEIQFAYQYEYVDGQTSVISPWSNMIKRKNKDGAPTQSVTLDVGVTEAIPLLVKRIHFIVRKGNNGVAYRVGYKTPSVSSVVTYSGQSVDVVESIYQKISELIPLTAKSATVSKGRLWLANYLEGYDTPIDSNISLLVELDTLPPAEGITISSYSEYKVGLVFFDQYGRSSSVLDKNWSLTVGNDLYNAAGGGRIKRMKVTPSGTPPSWAKSYAVVVSKNQLKNLFAEGFALATGQAETSQIKYLTSSAGVESESNIFISEPTAATKTINTVVDIYSAILLGQSYSFVQGDTILFRKFDSSETFGPLAIEKQIGNKIYLAPIRLGNNVVTGSPSFPPYGLSYQIIRPAKALGETLYYEVFNERLQNGQFPAGPKYWEGDSVNVQYSTLQQYYAQPAFKNNNSWNFSIGRPFIKTDQGQVNKRTYFKHSSPFIPGTGVNGLSEFNLGDERNVAIESVSIQKLQPVHKESTEGDVILAICNSDTYSIYLDEARITSGDGAAILSATSKVIGDVRKQKSGYGTLNPESVHEEDGDVWWFDKLARSFVRYSSNGIAPISNNKMIYYFERQADVMSVNDVVITGYDPFYKMMVTSFRRSGSRLSPSSYTDTLIRGISTPEVYYLDRNNIRHHVQSQEALAALGYSPLDVVTVSEALKLKFAEGSPITDENNTNTGDMLRTVSYSGLKDRWGSFFDFTPDAYVVGSDRLFSVVKGDIFSHDGDECNTFYGTSYPSRISLSFNDIPDTPKEWKVLQVQSNQGLVNFGGRAGTLTDSVGNVVFVDTSIPNGAQGGYRTTVNGTQEGWLLQIKIINGTVYGINNRNELFRCVPTIQNLGHILRADIANFKGQQTNITSEWDEDEQVTYGEIKCDINSDGGLLNGDSINSATMQVSYTFVGPEYKSIRLFKAGYEPSRGHTL